MAALPSGKREPYYPRWAASLIQASPLLREQILSYPSNLLMLQLQGRNDSEIRSNPESSAK
ncbi:hypothetical protein GX563_08150 [Candidatus Bathyarchaeota archaeon]|nr:hypothetical protein [Candidatus Bathyarchaeota archaeon]